MLSLPFVPVIVVPEMVTPELTVQVTLSRGLPSEGFVRSAQVAAPSTRAVRSVRPSLGCRRGRRRPSPAPYRISGSQ